MQPTSSNCTNQSPHTQKPHSRPAATIRTFKPLSELFRSQPATAARTRRDRLLIETLIKLHWLSKLICEFRGLLFDALAEPGYSYDRAKSMIAVVDSVGLLTVLGTDYCEIMVAIIGEVDSE